MKKVQLFLMLFIVAVAFSCTTNESFADDEILTKNETLERRLPNRLCTITTLGHQYYIDEHPNGTYTISDDFGYIQTLQDAAQAYEHCEDAVH